MEGHVMVIFILSLSLMASTMNAQAFVPAPAPTSDDVRKLLNENFNLKSFSCPHRLLHLSPSPPTPDLLCRPATSSADDNQATNGSVGRKVFASSTPKPPLSTQKATAVHGLGSRFCSCSDSSIHSLFYGIITERLAKRWKNVHSDEDDSDGKYSLPTTFNFQPMDTEEQEELVKSLERSHAQQSRFWRRVFAGMLCCFVSFLIFSIHGQTTMPWELRYHAYFMGEIESWIVIAADWGAVLVCSMAIAGLLHNSPSQSHRQFLWFSCCSALLLALFWLYNMLKLPKFRWDVIWLPFGPLSGAGFCLYVDTLLNESSEEVKKLRSYMYAYKSR